MATVKLMATGSGVAAPFSARNGDYREKVPEAGGSGHGAGDAAPDCCAGALGSGHGDAAVEGAR
jgi:hypothetical protein